jgi:2-hydroxychromene-2-carboxylate isomerase
MPQRVEFFFDVGSPASYLAWTQLPDLCAQTGAELVIRPMLLGGVFQATGNASPATVPAKGAYTMMDLTRHAKRYGVDFRANPFFPINTLVLMRGAVGVQMHQSERLQAYLAAVFKAIWVDAQDLNQPALVAQTLQAAGFDPAQLLAWSGQAEVKNALRETTEEAVARGVFGAPTLFVGKEMFFGQDRLDMVREALG